MERERQQNDGTLADGERRHAADGGGEAVSDRQGVLAGGDLRRRHLAVGKTLILLHPPLHVASVSIWMGEGV